MDNWDELSWLKSGEYDAVKEKLATLDKDKRTYCPRRDCIFEAFKATPFNKVKVCLMGQDPYPNPRYATGLAFSIPPGLVPFPPTLQGIIGEYCSDLGYPEPRSGDLTKWCDEGVFLWNVIPTCEAWKSKSHDWPEWEQLTKEIVLRLSRRGVVFCALGAVARKFVQPETEIFEGGYEKITYEIIDPDDNRIIEVSHPSPRGRASGHNPFMGSKMFSNINLMLREIGFDPVDWRL